MHKARCLGDALYNVHGVHGGIPDPSGVGVCNIINCSLRVRLDFDLRPNGLELDRFCFFVVDTKAIFYLLGSPVNT